MRICTGCHAAKPEMSEFFAPHSSCRLGLNSKCRLCVQEKQRAWKELTSKDRATRRRELYREKTGPILLQKERDRAIAAPFRARARVMTGSAKDRCRAAGLPKPTWLTTDAVEAMLKAQPSCPCCGAAFRIEIYTGQVCDQSPSLDRFNPKGGYERENVELICWRCNNIKRNYGPSDLIVVAAWMLARTPLEEIAAQPVPQDLFQALEAAE